MSSKPLPAGMAYLKIAVPRETLEKLDAKASKEGIARQSLIAPVVNAFARGDIQQSYTIAPDPHGNAGRRV